MMIRPAPTIEEPFSLSYTTTGGSWAPQELRSPAHPTGRWAASKVPYLGAVTCGGGGERGAEQQVFGSARVGLGPEPVGKEAGSGP